MAYKIKVDSVAVPRAMTEFEDENGEKKYFHISTVYEKDQVVQDDDVSPLIHQLYKDGDEQIRSVYEKVADDYEYDKPPFDDYDKLSESDVRARMVNMLSEETQELKAYESRHQNRKSIVEYNIGYGESPVDREEGKVVGLSGYQEAEPGSKAEEAVKPKRGKAAEKSVNKNAETKPDTPKAEPKKPAAKRTSVKKDQPQSEE